MSILKRFEIWLLLALSLGAIVWVLQQDSAGDPTAAPADASPTAAADGSSLKLHRTTLERDYGNARLHLELRYANTSPRPFFLLPPDVRLLTTAGQEIPPFVLPVEKPAQIPADTTQDVRLRYWLDTAHLQTGLTLDLRGQRLEIKPPGPFALDRLENQKPQTWNGPIPLE
jgi:hypothetical protein